MTISAFLPVFNEEKRIEYALTSLQWCDEVIVLDKTSTDKTVQIAKEYGAKVYVMPNSTSYDVDEFDYFKYCTSEWIILFTASDIIDVKLACEIKKLIDQEKFDYDIIKVPYKRYILGIENKRSPWSSQYHKSVFRKTALLINKNGVHNAISFKSDKVYSIDLNLNSYLHHLTHESVDIMMDRHLRYWRGEGENYNDKSLKRALIDVLRNFKNVLLMKKSYLMGWNGVMLMFAFLSYHMMSFVYKWEKSNKGLASKEYFKLRNESLENWKKNEPNEK